MSSLRCRWSGAAGFGVSLALGAGVVWHPVATAAATIGSCAVVGGLWYGARLPKLFLTTLGILLLGYAFLGRGFAYLGVPPLLVGEITLAVGLLAAVVRGGVPAAFRSPLVWLLMIFAAWGAVRTIPYWGTHGTDALRDGVMWGYAVFALLVASFLPHSGWLSRVPEFYGRWLPWLLVWIPVGLVIQQLAGDSLPRAPGSDIALLSMKQGDAAVHLGGTAAFLLLGLHRVFTRPSTSQPSWTPWGWWMAWLVGFLVVATGNRGGLLAALTAILGVLVVRPLSEWGKTSLKVVLIAGVLTAVFFTFNLDFERRDTPRKVSPQQFLANLQSIAGGGSQEQLEGTKAWRLHWWDDIVAYTLFGEYFWTGKGFGINLADDDGYQVNPQTPLRSPHNGHLTILARAGVPGLLLWTLLQGTFAASLLRAYVQARRIGQERWARLNVWILSYWLAFMVNASFDVFLEGPQGGIWFWSVFGFGLAALEAQRSQHRAFERHCGWCPRCRNGTPVPEGA